MKNSASITKLGSLLLLAASCSVTPALADGLPVFTVPPQTQTVAPGSNVTLTASATGAVDYQWRFNGADLPGANASALTITNAQLTNAGYYNAIARNATGWVPGQLAYLSVADSSGSTVPFSNDGNTNARAYYQLASYPLVPITNGTAQLVAGPALDQMRPVGAPTNVAKGYFSPVLNLPPPAPPLPSRNVPAVAPGQSVYYRVDISYPNQGGVYTQPSTVLKLVAGGGAFSVPDASSLKFPIWLEWPEPLSLGNPPTNQVRIPGETVNFTNYYFADQDLGAPTVQWRKDGHDIPGATNLIHLNNDPFNFNCWAVLSITNLQSADAGIYDAVIYGNEWEVSPKISMSVQLTNGPGVFNFPRFSGSNFVTDLLGVPGRKYAVQWSTNLSAWNDLLTVSNSTGTATFSNAVSPSSIFYRARLLDY